MKRDKNDIRNIGRYLSRYGEPSQEHTSSAVDHVWEQLKPEAEREPMRLSLASDPGRVSRFRFAAIAAALLVMFLSAALIRNFVWTNLIHAVVEVADGDMLRVSGNKTQPVRSGESVREGEIVRSIGGGAMLTLADGSRVEMRAQSELSLERADDGVRIRLNKGSVIVNAAKQRTGHLYVQTKDVMVSVVGTVFFVNSEAAGSRVGVVEGEVHVQQAQQGQPGQTMQKLFPGQQIVTASSMASVPVAEEIAWSRSAEAHMALLQRSTAIEPPPLQFDAASIKPDLWPGPGGASGPILCKAVDGDFSSAPQIPVPSPLPAGWPFPVTAPLGRCVGRYVSLSSLVIGAYGVRPKNVSGIPDWARPERYQIEARAENPAATTKVQLREMLQAMLADRFKLRARRETKQSPGYALFIAKGGLKIREAVGAEEPLVIQTGNGGSGSRGGGEPGAGQRVVISGKTSIRAFADFLAICPQVGFLVADKTELTKNYDFNLILNWIPAPPTDPGFLSCNPTYDPPISKAIEDQLGLHLEPGLTLPEEFIIVEHAEKPSEN